MLAGTLISTTPFFRFFAPDPQIQDLAGETQFHDGPGFAKDAVSRMGFMSVIPIVHRGAKKPIEHYHLWKLPVSLSTAQCWSEFEPYWEQEKVKPKYVPTLCVTGPQGCSTFLGGPIRL